MTEELAASSIDKGVFQLKNHLANKRVLLVGANEVDEMMLRYMIEEQQASLRIAHTPQDSFQLIQNESFDLILMNTRIQGQNGLSLVKRLREQHGVKTPIIAISSKDLNGRGIYNGFDAVLVRPLEKVHFLQSVHQIMSV
jgi:PleD family two-component response regulator